MKSVNEEVLNHWSPGRIALDHGVSEQVARQVETEVWEPVFNRTAQIMIQHALEDVIQKECDVYGLDISNQT